MALPLLLSMTTGVKTRQLRAFTAQFVRVIGQGVVAHRPAKRLKVLRAQKDQQVPVRRGIVMRLRDPKPENADILAVKASAYFCP
ncbi:Uncharacterised protein [Pluralibacter gergoviae]|nr:Uncharacterised protein [Pluralibacter gergoviae]